MYYLIVFYYYVDISQDNLPCITLKIKYEIIYIKKKKID